MSWLLAAALAAPPSGEATYNDEWKQGYSAGVQDAEALNTLGVTGMGVGAGAVLAGTGIATCGVLGTPCVAAAVVAPAMVGWRTAPIPAEGEWESGSSDFQAGYLQGYKESARQRQFKAALVGGAVGAVVGTVGGVGVIFVADRAING